MGVVMSTITELEAHCDYFFVVVICLFIAAVLQYFFYSNGSQPFGGHQLAKG